MEHQRKPVQIAEHSPASSVWNGWETDRDCTAQARRAGAAAKVIAEMKRNQALSRSITR